MVSGWISLWTLHLNPLMVKPMKSNFICSKRTCQENIVSQNTKIKYSGSVYKAPNISSWKASIISYLKVQKSACGLLVLCCCLCPTLCSLMDCGTPGFPVLQYLPESAQTHVHWVSDTIQTSHPLLPPLFCLYFPK